MVDNQEPILECRKICKTFPGVKALHEVDFQLMPGEIHGLVGENGAGKSTLIKIFSGVYSYDDIAKTAGDNETGLFFQGEKIILKTPGQAIKHKIMTIHQEINVIPDLMVYDNIFLNNEDVKSGLLNRSEMKKKADEMLEKFGADFSTTDMVKNLSTDKQKLVEVLKAISQDAKVIIMDEPTSVLTDTEARHLFEVMRNIAHQGIAIIFISHNLKEILELCNRITILKDGKLVGTMDKNELNVVKIISFMVGKKIEEVGQGQPFKSFKTNEELFRIEKYNFRSRLIDVSFKLNKGEVIGITGLVGSGGSDLAKTVFGMEGHKKDSGELYLEGKKVMINNTGDAIKNKIAFLTEDRKGEGLFLKFKIYENITLPSLNKFMDKAGFLDEAKRKDVSEKYVESLRIKAPDSNMVTEMLSGGNQQKVVIAKWLETNPNILIMAEPTVGIDVAAKSEIRNSIKSLAKKGKGIILITNEFIELQELCDRVLIMFKGEIIKELTREEINEDAILKYALGGRN